MGKLPYWYHPQGTGRAPDFPPPGSSGPPAGGGGGCLIVVVILMGVIAFISETALGEAIGNYFSGPRPVVTAKPTAGSQPAPAPDTSFTWQGVWTGGIQRWNNGRYGPVIETIDFRLAGGGHVTGTTVHHGNPQCNGRVTETERAWDYDRWKLYLTETQPHASDCIPTVTWALFQRPGQANTAEFTGSDADMSYAVEGTFTR